MRGAEEYISRADRRRSGSLRLGRRFRAEGPASERRIDGSPRAWLAPKEDQGEEAHRSHVDFGKRGPLRALTPASEGQVRPKDPMLAVEARPHRGRLAFLLKGEH